MHGDVKYFLQAMAAFGRTDSRKKPYVAHIKSVSKGVALLDNGVAVEVPGKASEWTKGIQVLVVPTDMNPKAVRV
jgi:hypothetical protein